MVPQPSAEQFRAILDGLSEAVCRLLPDGTLTYVNKAFCELLSVRSEDVVGTVFTPRTHPADVEIARGCIRSITLSHPRNVATYRVLLPAEGMRWIQWSRVGLFDASGRLVGYQCTARDVSDRIEAAERLRRQTESARFLAEASRLLASSLDYETTLEQVVHLAVPFLADDCRVSLVNDEGAWERVAGANVDPSLVDSGMSLLVLKRADMAGVHHALQQVMAGEAILVPDLTADGLEALRLPEPLRSWSKRIQAQSYMLVPLAGHDQVMGVMAFTSSRVHSKRVYGPEDLQLAEELGRRAAQAIENAQLVRALRDQDESKNRFLATLGHELRNPLAAIHHALDVLDVAPQGDAAYTRALQVARRQVRHQTRLVDDLLDVARLTRGTITLQRVAIDAREQVREVVEDHRPAAQGKQQRLDFSAPEAVWLQADPARLQQIVSNLVDNAIKYSPPGAHIEVAASRHSGAVRIAVRDDGPGIPRHLHAHIFEPFVQGEPTHQTPSAGIGMGMTIVRKLVELHGGAVEIGPGLGGKGTEVTVTLPAAAIPEREAPIEHTTDDHRLRVLVVDDNADAADMLASLIETWDHDVQAVYSGREAVELIAQKPPDLVLMDIGMPEMNGYEAARAIRKLLPSEPPRLVALSGYARPSDVAEALEAGFERHLAKPVDGPTIRDLLAEHVAAHGH